jgi:type I restriction enzyme R subunit
MHKSRHYRGGFEYSGSLTLTRELRQTSTDAESLLWDKLRNRQLLGFKFRRQHQIGKYVVDFCCGKAGLVIECDGGIHSRAQAWQHDQNREAYMSALRLRTLRFTNEEVLNETERVLSEISDYLRGAAAQGSKR